MIGLNGIAVPQDLFDHLGPVANVLDRIGVIPDSSWTVNDLARTAIWISALMFVALACPNTLQILARYEPALGVKPRSTSLVFGSIRVAEWTASFPWAIAVSVLAAIAVVSIGGPSEFLYWQF
jgi:alginate O-acetyltransferase complex protein AlgI